MNFSDYFDGLFRRVQETRDSQTLLLTYSADWQILEEFTNGSLTNRYVYSPIYVDALLFRDRDVDSNGSLEERIFALQDANYNIIALTNSTGTVIDRMEYKPFGEVSVLNDTVDWKHYYQGGRADETTGLISFRFRWYSPELGRWTQQDPIHFAAGDINIYRAIGNDPLNGLDPSGLQDLFKNIPAQPGKGGDLLQEIDEQRQRDGETRWGNEITQDRRDWANDVINGAPILIIEGALSVGKVVIAAGIASKAGDLIEQLIRNGNRVKIENSGNGGGGKVLQILDDKGRKLKGKEVVEAIDSAIVCMAKKRKKGQGSDAEATEKLALDIARQIERDLGKQARRKFHDAKLRGAGDRTKEELKSDAADIYKDEGREVPKWLR